MDDDMFNEDLIEKEAEMLEEDDAERDF